MSSPQSPSGKGIKVFLLESVNCIMFWVTVTQRDFGLSILIIESLICEEKQCLAIQYSEINAFKCLMQTTKTSYSTIVPVTFLLVKISHFTLVEKILQINLLKNKQTESLAWLACLSWSLSLSKLVFNWLICFPHTKVWVSVIQNENEKI